MPPPISMRLTPPEGIGRWPPPVLDPAGPYAGSISLLSWVLLAGAGIILLIVLGALWAALFGRPSLQQRLGGRTTVTLHGPETRAREVQCPANGEWFAIRFRAGTFMPGLPVNTMCKLISVSGSPASPRRFCLLK